MRRNNKVWMILVILAVVVAVFVFKRNKGDNGGRSFQEIHPVVGNISRSISTTGTVNPQNRLEIKPPIAGRIEKILVEEGQDVRVGDILALMSSTERAALLDAAMLKGEDEVKYWQEAYKVTPLIAPIEGVIIVRAVEPGQTVTTSEAVIVISDRLIVEADVDETDIGEIKVGQRSVIGLDAYPKVQIKASVDHISYESELVNNVNIYSVDIVPEEVPDIFRSGMSANVEVITNERDGVLTLPVEAIEQKNGENFVTIKEVTSGKDRQISVEIGVWGEDRCEILSGLAEEDVVLIPSDGEFLIKKHMNGGSPFTPFGKKN